MQKTSKIAIAALAFISTLSSSPASGQELQEVCGQVQSCFERGCSGPYRLLKEGNPAESYFLQPGNAQINLLLKRAAVSDTAACVSGAAVIKINAVKLVNF